MKQIAFFDTKPYDRIWFDKLGDSYPFSIRYFESKLTPDTAVMAAGSDAVCAFVNDQINADVVDTLVGQGIGVLAMRCAGYNNVDFKAAFGRLHVLRVPAYSPHAVAEHAMALLLALNRKIPRAYIRTRDYNFSLNGLIGFDLYGKTIGIVGTGKIGQAFCDICRGFGMRVVAYDPYPNPNLDIEYLPFDLLCQEAHIISLHCPLTKETHHIVNETSLAQMRDGVLILNTSRGSLIDSEALTDALKSGKVGGAGLDVYEEESDLFFEDVSDAVLQDDVLARLISMPNVIVTSHQAFLTHEALAAIAKTTLENLQDYFSGGPLPNEICYQCEKKGRCDKGESGRCF